MLHKDQKRKGDGLPYIVHPYSVAFILSHYTKDEDVIVAGLMRDVLEDVPEYKKKDFLKDFGEKVYDIVKEVTEEKDTYPNRRIERASWQRRKEKYLKNLQDASEKALLVCCADKIHNLNSMMAAYKAKGEKIWKNFNAPKDRILWYYGEVVKIMEMRLHNPITEELENTYARAVDLFE